MTVDVSKQIFHVPVVSTGLTVAKQIFHVPVVDRQDTLAISAAEVDVWYDGPPEAASFANMEVSAWIDAPSEAGFSMMEVSAWLDAGGSRRKQVQAG